MASTIRIKRSTVSGNPGTLAAGELAYSGLTDNGSNGGDRLYIGLGTEFGGNAANHFVIGGKYFTDMMDHTRGTLVANSAILVDGDKKINELFVNNLKLTDNTISSEDTNGNIVLDPNGSGNVVVKTGAKLVVEDLSPTRLVFIGDNNQLTDAGVLTFTTATGVLSLTGQLNVDNISINDSTIATLSTNTNLVLNPNGTGLVSIANAYSLPRADGSTGYVLTTNGNGTVSWSAASSSLSLAGDGATTGTVNLLTQTLSVNGSTGISAAISGTNVNLTLSVADTTTLGIASFNTANFNVSSGYVTAKNITIGTSTATLGSTLSSINGLDQITVDNIQINGNEISALDTNGNISLKPNGTGTVAVNNSRIIGLAEPLADSDAATKYYVDNKITGLTWKTAVNVLSNTQTSLTGSWPYSIDSHAIEDGYRVLLIGQNTNSEDGIYTVTTSTGTYSLIRSTDADTYQELVGSAVFIQEGSVYANTGWVQSNTYLNSFSGQSWNQFSGAGAYTAGEGLSVDGTNFSVNVSPTGGIEISADNLQLKHGVAGDGLTYADGVIDVVGTTNRISVTADAIDISTTYAGQGSINTVGTLTNAVWNATTIATSYGGTGRTTFNTGDLLIGTTGSLAILAVGLPGKVLQVNQAGNSLEYADLDGGTY
jgi:hypothetical protein